MLCFHRYTVVRLQAVFWANQRSAMLQEASQFSFFNLCIIRLPICSDPFYLYVSLSWENILSLLTST